MRSKMPSGNPPQDWVDRLVEVEFLEIAGEQDVLVGWLWGITGRGVYFAKAFHSGTLDKLMPEPASFYPWGIITDVRLIG